MVTEVDAMTGLEFDLGNEKTFTFGLDDDYKAQLVEKNSRLDEYLILTSERMVAGITIAFHTEPLLTTSTRLFRLHTDKAAMVNVELWTRQQRTVSHRGRTNH